MTNRLKMRQVATEFVEQVNAKTVCASCGNQPIEWHREYHERKPNSRVSSLRTQGCSVARIKQEMSLCEPLCRSCHMNEDGRLKELRRNQPQQRGQVYVGKLPCSCCGREAKPLRNKRCVTCDNHHSGRRIRTTKSCDGCHS